MKKVLIFIFGASFCSSVGRLKRELNQNCPDLELWNQCATKCDQTLIECIQTCQNSTEITCISDCNRENIACETGKFDGHSLCRTDLIADMGIFPFLQKLSMPVR